MNVSLDLCEEPVRQNCGTAAPIGRGYPLRTRTIRPAIFAVEYSFGDEIPMISHLAAPPVPSSGRHLTKAQPTPGSSVTPIVLILAFVTFSRVAQVLLGLPTAVNHLHFPVVLLAFLLSGARTWRREKTLCVLLACFALVIAASAAAGGAGATNAVLEFLLLSEPVMLLLLIVGANPSVGSAKWLSRWLLVFGLVQVPFAYLQVPYYTATLPDANQADLIRGTMLGMIDGAHVVGAVSVVCAVYMLFFFRLRSVAIKTACVALLVLIPLLSDAKQVLVAFVIACIVVAVGRMRHLGTPRMRALVAVLLVVGVCIVGAVIRIDMWLCRMPMMVQGLSAKLAVLQLIGEYRQSGLSWVLGLGPGHSVGRLGFLLPKYWDLLSPLGATVHPLTQQVWALWDETWALHVSSIFSPFFGWAGIFGDLGIAGIAVYGAMWVVIYMKYCHNNVSRIFLVFTMVLGAVFTWLEEPNFMLYVVSVIGCIHLDSRGQKSTYEGVLATELFHKWLSLGHVRRRDAQ